MDPVEVMIDPVTRGLERNPALPSSCEGEVKGYRQVQPWIDEY
jgi:hypothetical protein